MPSALGTAIDLIVAGSADSTLLNISTCGVLIETPQRRTPGENVGVFVLLADRRQRARATVVRCYLHALAPVLRFRVALHFEREIKLPDSVSPPI